MTISEHRAYILETRVVQSQDKLYWKFREQRNLINLYTDKEDRKTARQLNEYAHELRRHIISYNRYVTKHYLANFRPITGDFMEMIAYLKRAAYMLREE